MNPAALSTVLRVIIQLALSGGVIVFSPVLLLLCGKIPQAVVQHDWAEVFLGALLPLGLFGIAALCLSVFATPAFIARGRKRRMFIFSGLGAGLFVYLVLVARFPNQSARLPEDWLAYYLTFGPASVAVWNIYRLKRRANQSPQRNAGSRPSSGDSPASGTTSSLGPRG
jgi:hypothetical protein